MREPARVFWLDQLIVLRPYISDGEARFLALNVQVSWMSQPGIYAYSVRGTTSEPVLLLHPALQHWHGIEQTELCLSAAMNLLAERAAESLNERREYLLRRATQLGFCPTPTPEPRERWRWISAHCTQSVLSSLEDRPSCGLCRLPLSTGSTAPGRPDDTCHHECRVYAEQVLAPQIRAARQQARTEAAHA